MAGGSQVSPPRILVVEDEEDVRLKVMEDLQGQFELQLACSQEEAFTRLGVLTAPDGVLQLDGMLLDLHLPVRSGELAKDVKVGEDILIQVRRQKLLRRSSGEPLPVVVMTAHGLTWDTSRRLIRQLKATDFIGKAPPWKAEELLATLCGALDGDPDEERPIRLAFDLDRRRVYVESLPAMEGQWYEILSLLRDRSQDPDTRDEGIRAKEVGAALDLTEHTVRQAVRRFRQEMSQAFERQLRRSWHSNDIVESSGGSKGYRLNRQRVRIVDLPRQGGSAPLRLPPVNRPRS